MIEKYRSFPVQVKASFWFTICGFIQKAISLLTTPIFTRLLSTSDYGIISVYTTWSNIILIFASLNLASGVYMRGMIKYEEDEEQFTTSLQSLFLINISILFVVFLIFSDFLTKLLDLSLIYIVFMFIDMYVVTIFQFWSVRQRVNYKYKNLVLLTIINAIIKPIFGILAILIFDNNVLARITTLVFADVIVFGFLFLKAYRPRPKLFLNKYWKYALLYNLPLVPHYLSQVILNQSDRLMINSIVGEEAAGIYSLAYTAATILLIVNQSILNSYNPWMYKMIKEKNYNNINSVSTSLLILVGILNLGLILFAPEAVKILATESYYEAIWVIPPVTMSVFFIFMYSLFANFEFYFEKTKLMMIASVSGAVLNVVLNLVFIKKYGYFVAGYTTLFCYIAYCIFHYIVMRYLIKKNNMNINIYNIKIILLISIVFIILAFVFMLLYNYTFIRILLAMLLMLTVVALRKQVFEFLQKILSIKNA